MAILETKDMTYYYQDGENRRKILDKTNISFEKGKFYTILGKSGSGKTTFLSLISALDQPTDGEVFFEEKNIKTIGYEEYRRNKISLIFQSYNLIPYLTALENVLVSMAISDNKLPDQHDQIAYRLLDYIGINSTKADRFVNQLSSCTVPIGNKARNTRRTIGPAINNCNGNATITFFPMLLSQLTNTE